MIKHTILLLTLVTTALSGQEESPNPPSPAENQPQAEPQAQPKQQAEPLEQAEAQSLPQAESPPKDAKIDSSAVLVRVSQESSQPKAEVQPNTPTVTPTVTQQGKIGFFDKVRSFFRRIINASALPWCIAILMAGLAGAAGAWVMMLTKQDRRFNALRQKVIDATESVHLLPEEATRLLRNFREDAVAATQSVRTDIAHHRAEVERIVHEAENSSRASREETLRTVDTFKTSLNGMLGNLTKFMERVTQDTGKTHSQALDTKEYAKNVAELIHAKEREITRLKEGYDLHLITPLTKAFLKIRDDLHAMAPHIVDNQIKRQLGDLDQKIVAALGDLSIKEIEIPEDLKEFPARNWESLGASEATDDPARHGMRARIKEMGYQFKMPNAEPHIIRKAVVVVYSCQTLADSGEQRITSIGSESANNMAGSPSAEHPTNNNQ